MSASPVCSRLGWGRVRCGDLAKLRGLHGERDLDWVPMFRPKLPNSPVIEPRIIYRMAKAGGSKTPVAVGQQSPFNMAGDADSVNWANRVSNVGSIMRLAK